MKLGSTNISRLYVGGIESTKVYLGLTEVFNSWTPQKLFTAGEQGVWYDPSDLTTMFQDTFGSTPVTAAGQTVALMLDKSQGLVQGEATDAIGWVNAGFGSFSTDGTSVTFEKTVAGGTDQTYSSAQFAVTAGTRYEIEVNVSEYFGPFQVFFSQTTNSRGDGFTITSAGVQKFFLIPSATASLSLNFRTTTTGGGASVSVASVGEAPLGNHASQATTASRPTYGYHPEGGIRNLTPYTEELDNALWNKNGTTISPDVTVAPDGLTTADKLIETDTTALHGTRPPPGVLLGEIATWSVYLKEGERRYAVVSHGGSSIIRSGRIFVDLRDGSVILSAGTNLISHSVTSVGNGWYRCSVSVDMTGETESPASFVFVNDDDTNDLSGNYGYKVYDGDGTSGIFIWGAQLEAGARITPYQRVGNEYDVTEAGVPLVHYLSFDGVDDFMVTPTITPSIDKVQVIAGVRKLSDDSSGIILESSTTIVNNGSFGVFGPDNAGAATYGVGNKGTILRGANASASAPSTDVITAEGDIGGDITRIRKNGLVSETNTLDLGTGDYLAYPLFIGRRGGTAYAFTGNIYSLVTRFGANLETASIESAETYTANKTGVTL